MKGWLPETPDCRVGFPADFVLYLYFQIPRPSALGRFCRVSRLEFYQMFTNTAEDWPQAAHCARMRCDAPFCGLVEQCRVGDASQL